MYVFWPLTWSVCLSFLVFVSVLMYSTVPWPWSFGPPPLCMLFRSVHQGVSLGQSLRYLVLSSSVSQLVGWWDSYLVHLSGSLVGWSISLLIGLSVGLLVSRLLVCCLLHQSFRQCIGSLLVCHLVGWSLRLVSPLVSLLVTCLVHWSVGVFLGSSVL